MTERTDKERALELAKLMMSYRELQQRKAKCYAALAEVALDALKKVKPHPSNPKSVDVHKRAIEALEELRVWLESDMVKS